jgi:HK97 family phage major capsid protein
LSLGKLLRGYVTGEWTGAAAEQKAMGSSPLSSGGMLIPTPLAADVIDLARNQTRLLQAGAITVPMSTATLKYARLSQDATANWTSEAANIALSAAAFDSVTFTARKLAALVAIDNELLEDAANADATIENSIAKALALALDFGGLYGSGTPPQPQGLHGIVPTVASGGTLTNFDAMLGAIAAVRGANFEPNAALYSARTADAYAKLKTGLSGDQRFLPPPTDFAALSKFVTNQIPNNLGTGTNESQAFIGQWDQLALGLRSSLQIEVSREAGYFDGSAQQSAFSKDQTIIRAILRADWQPLHLGAFAEVTGITSV